MFFGKDRCPESNIALNDNVPFQSPQLRVEPQLCRWFRAERTRFIANFKKLNSYKPKKKRFATSCNKQIHLLFGSEADDTKEVTNSRSSHLRWRPCRMSTKWGCKKFHHLFATFAAVKTHTKQLDNCSKNTTFAVQLSRNPTAINLARFGPSNDARRVFMFDLSHTDGVHRPKIAIRRKQ